MKYKGNNKAVLDGSLVLAFYLINFAFVSLFLSIGTAPESQQGAFEYPKMGVVLLLVGGMHFFNMFNFTKMRNKAKRVIKV